MATFFLVIIYLAFISLGLPDSLLGVSWSLMQSELGAPLETAGLLFMTIAGGTIISSFVSGVKLALLSFLFYCGAEATIGLWGSSFLVNVKELSVDVAAKWVSLYYAGITIGRFITGFITLKVSNTTLIRIGQITALAGAILLFLPLPSTSSLVGFIMVGLGLAPIFPCMLQETPIRFGQEHSQTIMGYQMAVAYTGSTFLPPLLGLIAAHSTIGIFPFVIAGFIVIMLSGSEKLNVVLSRNDL